MKKAGELGLGIVAMVFAVTAAMVFVFGMIAAIAAIDAYLLTLLWPLVIPNVFPSLVATQAIAGTVGFKPMFALVFFVLVLRPSSYDKIISSKSSKETKNDE